MLGEKSQEQKGENLRIKTISAKELYDMNLPPIRFIVDGLLPQGLHVFAGPPKIGKSWLMLQIALAVASGKEIWGLKTEKGTVLSLCLEDSLSRLQQRLSELTDDPPDRLHLATFSKSLADGLCDQLVSFLKEHGDTNLVIIDTLQKVRGNSGDGNLYASDYQDIGLLKQIADEYQIAVVLIHHLRKREASDPHAMISGTTGLVGAADGSYVLRRENAGDREVQLYVRGRDVEDKILTLERDDELNEWILVECDTPLTDSLGKEPVLLRLIEAMEHLKSFDGSATQLVEQLKLDVQPNILSRKLNRHRQALQKAGVTFSLSRTGKQRFLSLRYQDDDDMTITARGDTEPSPRPQSLGNTG